MYKRMKKNVDLLCNFDIIFVKISFLGAFMNLLKKLVIVMLFTTLLCTAASAAVCVDEDGKRLSFSTVNEAASYLGKEGGKIIITAATSVADGEEFKAQGCTLFQKSDP